MFEDCQRQSQQKKSQISVKWIQALCQTNLTQDCCCQAPLQAKAKYCLEAVSLH